MLYLDLPKNIKEKVCKIDVPGEKLESGDHHITLFYFPEPLPIDVVGEMMEDLFEFLKNKKAFELKVDQIDSFPKGEDGIPLIMKVKSKELREFRKDLEKIMEKHKAEFSKKFDFNPHLTLSYSLDDDNEGFEEKVDELKFKPISLSYKASRDIDNEEVSFHIAFENKNSFGTDLLEGMLKII